MKEKIDLIVGAVFVMFHAANRFNTPATNRSSTTAGRYYLALGLYLLVGLGLYLTLVHCPHLTTFLAQGDEVGVPDWAKDLSSPLVVALALTLLLPKIPFLSGIDQWVFRRLQDMAAIPFEVRRLMAELLKAPFQLSPEDEKVVRQRLEAEGFEPADLLFGREGAPRQLWTFTAALLMKLEEWASDRKMVSYLAGAQAEGEKLRKRHQHLAGKAKTCFRLIREGAEGGATGKAHEAARSYQEDFMEQLVDLQDDLVDFISRGVLQCELTDVARNKRLGALGFTVRWARQRLTLNQIMLVFGLAGVVTLMGLVIGAGQGRDVSFSVLLARAVMIAANYSAAVACVVLAKERWRIAQFEPGQVRPVCFYLLAGLLAVVIGQAISLGFNAVIFHSLKLAALRLTVAFPWATLAFATAIVTGFLVDNPAAPVGAHGRQRLLEGLTQAGVMAVAGLVTRLWLMDTVSSPAAAELHWRVPAAPAVILLPAVIGFVIGYCVPTWYREAPRAAALGKERAGEASPVTVAMVPSAVALTPAPTRI